ncbi:hypothetical protein L3Q82_005043 [Scortum barcoo]|uniref:Uncharacterized protein n=1 Tax=Scortum barcoo TaxID=214431 RepID=A0ACB8VGZ9_9TELE|nr:hypothetical protein L3Q82_005043 [Scortum barcoo]
MVTFTREKLLNIGSSACKTFLPVFFKPESFTEILVGGAAALYGISRRRCRGKRAGARQTETAGTAWTALSSIHLVNVRCLANKMDELLLLNRKNTDVCRSAALCFTETWLGEHIPDTSLHLLDSLRDLCKDPVCGLQFSVQYHRPGHPPLQTLLAHCQWISNFLTDRRQHLRLGSITYSTRTISTGAPQGCVLSPLLFSLYTNDCTSGDLNVKLLKFADDTTVIGLIRDGDESAYRQEVEQLALWCGQNNLEPNTQNCGDDSRLQKESLNTDPLSILNNRVSAVETFRFLGSTISQDLKWESNIDAIRKEAQQRMYFLHQVRKFNLPQELLIQFYTAIIQSVLCTSNHSVVWISHQTGQEQTTTDSQDC